MMGFRTFFVALTVAELLARAQCSPDWENFIQSSPGVQRVHLLPSYDDVDYTCSNWASIRVHRSTDVCDGAPHCDYEGSYDESHDLCAPSLEYDLHLRQSFTSNTTVHLAWSRPPVWLNKPSGSGSNGKFKLAGFFLTGIFGQQAFKKNIHYGLIQYVVPDLNPGTKYQIILRPFYVDDMTASPRYRIGRASTIQLQTLASAPEAPLKVDLVRAGTREVVIRVTGPFLWNGIPLGYRVRWLPVGRHGESGEALFMIPSSQENEMLDITLNLKPGESYQIFVLAVNTDQTGATYEGPAAITNIGTIPSEPTSVVANLIAPGSIMVKWKSRGQASYFRIIAQYPSYERTTLNIDSQTYEDSEHTAIVDLPPSRPVRHDHPDVHDMPPPDSPEDEVIVASCSVSGCSSDVAARVVESFQGTRRVLILGAYSENTTSFKVNWTPLNKSETLIDGFNVRYCGLPLQCRATDTDEQSFVASNLTPGTTYDIEVRARYRSQNGATRLGPAARTTITTWTLVPQKPHLIEKSAGPNFVVASWHFKNSILTYFQISREYGVWTNCTSGENCTVDVVSNQPLYYRRGFITFTSLVPHTNYSFSVRGCNEYGCGEGETLQTPTRPSEPSAPLNLNVTRGADGVVEIGWDTPAESNGPLNGYMVSWECSPGEMFTLITNDTVATIEGFNDDGDNCTVSVAGFNLDDEENMLLGRSDTVSFP